MQYSKQHISFFLLMVYFITFAMLPATSHGETQLNKECPNKKALFTSEINNTNIGSVEFQIDTEKQNNRTASSEISSCSSTTIFIVQENNIKLNNAFVPNSVKGFFPKIYESPYLENLKSPPKNS